MIEVSDTSLSRDSTVKAELYAETGIPEYWLLDVQGDALIVHSDLKNGIYQSVSIRRRGGTIRPKELAAFEFTVDEILGQTGL